MPACLIGFRWAGRSVPQVHCTGPAMSVGQTFLFVRVYLCLEFSSCLHVLALWTDRNVRLPDWFQMGGQVCPTSALYQPSNVRRTNILVCPNARHPTQHFLPVLARHHRGQGEKKRGVNIIKWDGVSLVNPAIVPQVHCTSPAISVGQTFLFARMLLGLESTSCSSCVERLGWRLTGQPLCAVDISHPFRVPGTFVVLSEGVALGYGIRPLWGQAHHDTQQSPQRGEILKGWGGTPTYCTTRIHIVNPERVTSSGC